MSTEHETLFSALSDKIDIPQIEILEIGTYDGANSFLLSSYFKTQILPLLTFLKMMMNLPILMADRKILINLLKNEIKFYLKEKILNL